jgi:AhpD family alkylhydroperoxidase
MQTTVEKRFDWYQSAPQGLQALLGLQTYVNAAGLEHSLLELVKMRASQINGCAYCLDMHFKDATAAGETAQRLYLLDAWRETKFYSARERAALEWTEALTLVTQGHVPDEVYQSVRQHFSEQELANLSLAIVAINGWNRMCIAFRVEAGTYQVSRVRRKPD